MAQRGPAYDFWLRVKAEQANRGWTDSDLHRRSGVSRNTINGLKIRKRVEAGTVNALADALDIPREQAHQWSGLVPVDEQASHGERIVSVREAIKHDTLYTEEQRRVMLQLVDMFAAANRSRTQQDEPGGEAQAS